jgi:hypothetical protein
MARGYFLDGKENRLPMPSILENYVPKLSLQFTPRKVQLNPFNFSKTGRIEQKMAAILRPGAACGGTRNTVVVCRDPWSLVHTIQSWLVSADNWL